MDCGIFGVGQINFNHGGKNDGVASYFFYSTPLRVRGESSAPKGIATLEIQIFCHDKNLNK